MDLNLRPEDLNSVPTGGDGGLQISNSKPSPVTSSDFVARVLLSEQVEEPLKEAPLSRPSKMERISTGDTILKDEKLGRMTSGDWNMEEFRDDSSIAMKQLLGGKPKPGCVGSICFGLERLSTADMDFEDETIIGRQTETRLRGINLFWVGKIVYCRYGFRRVEHPSS